MLQETGFANIQVKSQKYYAKNQLLDFVRSELRFESNAEPTSETVAKAVNETADKIGAVTFSAQKQ